MTAEQRHSATSMAVLPRYGIEPMPHHNAEAMRWWSKAALARTCPLASPHWSTTWTLRIPETAQFESRVLGPACKPRG